MSGKGLRRADNYRDNMFTVQKLLNKTPSCCACGTDSQDFHFSPKYKKGRRALIEHKSRYGLGVATFYTFS